MLLVSDKLHNIVVKKRGNMHSIKYKKKICPFLTKKITERPIANKNFLV